MKTEYRTFRSSSAGFTLIELLVTVAVVVILATAATSGFGTVVERKHLVAATNAIDQELQLARRETRKRSSNLVVSFATGASWCLGIDTASCDCTTASDCSIKELAGATVAKGTSMSAATFSGASFFTIDRVRGTVSSTGNVDLQTGSGLDLRVELMATGRARLCSPSDNLVGYPSC